MFQIAPSILSADFNCLGKQIRETEEAGITILHIDVMDGMFVPSISFGMPVIASIRKKSRLFFDVHLMVQEPGRYLEEFVKAGADSITVHVEACKEIGKTLQEIRHLGKQCGLALNPETALEEVLPYLSQTDMLLVMSVHPGFGGQKLIPETLDKVRKLYQLRTEEKRNYRIEIDGGMNIQNIGQAVSAGADIIVAGTAVFTGSVAENLKRIREVV